MEMLLREKAELCKRFKMEDMGEIREVLGLTVTRDRTNKVLTISQPDFIKNILVRFGMENSKPVATPMETGSHFYKFEEGDKAFDKQQYQQAIGCLTYATISTRPDISAAVNNLSQYMACPSEKHWKVNVFLDTCKEPYIMDCDSQVTMMQCCLDILILIGRAILIHDDQLLGMFLELVMLLLIGVVKDSRPLRDLRPKQNMLL